MQHRREEIQKALEKARERGELDDEETPAVRTGEEPLRGRLDGE